MLDGDNNGFFLEELTSGITSLYGAQFVFSLGFVCLGRMGFLFSFVILVSQNVSVFITLNKNKEEWCAANLACGFFFS